MKRRNVLAMLMAGAMSLSLLAGCSGGGETQTQNPGSNNPGTTNTDNAGGGSSGGEATDITLKVFCPSNQIDTGIMKEQQEAFQAEHPEWNLTWEVTAVGEDKCQEEVLRDVEAAADVFFFANDQLPDLVSAGAIAQLGGSTAEMVEQN
ncbi:MAG: hypothetical protein K2K53_11280, partial [Oscillospiraceae bacterium]|nr:hypothetical protein [Oscillospiraceae bacterium]